MTWKNLEAESSTTKKSTREFLLVGSNRPLLTGQIIYIMKLDMEQGQIVYNTKLVLKQGRIRLHMICTRDPHGPAEAGSQTDKVERAGLSHPTGRAGFHIF